MYEKDGICYADDPTPIAKVTALRALTGYRLWLRFKTGEEKIYNFESELEYPVFKPLKDKTLFDSVFICGGVPAWNDGDIDFSAESLLAYGTDAPETSLSPADRARPIIDRDRWDECVKIWRENREKEKYRERKMEKFG